VVADYYIVSSINNKILKMRQFEWDVYLNYLAEGLRYNFTPEEVKSFDAEGVGVFKYWLSTMGSLGC